MRVHFGGWENWMSIWYWLDKFTHLILWSNFFLLLFLLQMLKICWAGKDNGYCFPPSIYPYPHNWYRWSFLLSLHLSEDAHLHVDKMDFMCGWNGMNSIIKIDGPLHRSIWDKKKKTYKNRCVFYHKIL